MTHEAQMTLKANDQHMTPEGPMAAKRMTPKANEYIWALRDINLEVSQGDVLGIIGKNGAGKSTLLKILSKVTAPTTGTIKARGRIASLLEVGTGFHPEMTGRENIYMNGSIMGMSKAEITHKLDEIIDFAGVEQFIDTPVKRYSSGMTVRLGFAVAAHLEPEILVVDEVLAVGDAEFQRKAIGKIQDISKWKGRTVLFVSHNMASIENLCKKTILLNEGYIIKSGNTNDIIDHYLNSSNNLSKIPIYKRNDRTGTQQISFYDLEVLTNQNIKVNSVSSGKNIILRIHYKKNVHKILYNCRISIAITKEYRPYIVLDSELVESSPLHISHSGYIDFNITELPLSKGQYSFILFIESNNQVLDCLEDAAILTVEDGDYYGNGKNYPKGWDGKTVLTRYTIKTN